MPIRERHAVMTSIAGNHKLVRTDHRVFYFKIFFVNAYGHTHHCAGYFLFGFGIAGKIKVAAIGAVGVTKAAGNAEAVLEIIYHNAVQVLRADVFWQHL